MRTNFEKNYLFNAAQKISIPKKNLKVDRDMEILSKV